MKRWKRWRLRQKATALAAPLVRGQWYRCNAPRCAWAWRYDGGDDWHGPRFPDGDTSCARPLTTEQLHDGYCDCWGRLIPAEGSATA